MVLAMVIETELAAPAFLVAVPQLADPNFNRAVVFVLEHGEEGSMGLVINRASNLEMTAFCASQNMTFNGDGSTLVYPGGPVQTDRAFILHVSGHEGPETENIFGDVRLSYSIESLRLIVASPPERLRVFLGYAGWGPGQLAQEVTAGAWLMMPPNDELIFRAPADDVWELALRQMGIDPVQLMHSGALH
jgi:putative transcriptional regulator